MNKIIVVIEDGNVRQVHSNGKDAEYRVLDYDEDALLGEEIWDTGWQKQEGHIDTESDPEEYVKNLGEWFKNEYNP